MNIQGWFPLGLTGLISLQSKGLSRVFSNTTVQKHQFFSTQPSLWFSSHICTWLLEKPWLPITSDPPQCRYLPLFPAWLCLASETLLFPLFEMVFPPLVLQRRAHTSGQNESLASVCFLIFLKRAWKQALFFFWPCPMACGILVPPPRIEHTPFAVETQSLNHWTAREVLCFVFNYLFLCVSVSSLQLLILLDNYAFGIF